MPTLVADACLLITLGNAGALWLLRDLPGWISVTCPRAVAEVVRPPASREVANAIEAGWMNLVSVDLTSDAESRALAWFDDQLAFRGRADAEILALAAVHGFTVGSDDRRVRAEARKLGADRVAGSVEILVRHVRAGRVAVSEAEELLERFDVEVRVDLARLVIEGSA